MLQPTEILLQGGQFKKLYDKMVGEMAAHYGLTPTEVNILLFLVNNPSYDTARDIVQTRGLPKSSVSKAVDSLIRQGFLRSCPDEKDRRIQHLSIQDAARPLVEDAQQAQHAFLACIYNGFSEEERQTLNALTEKISQNIKEALQKCC